MASVNKVILIGRLGKDPELKHTPGGAPVCSFSMATEEKYKGKDGEYHRKTEWHNLVAWNKTAELINQYTKKGSMVYVEGKLTTRSWNDRDGNKHYKTEVVVSTVVFMGGSRVEPGERQETADHGFNDSEPPIKYGDVSDDDLPF